MLWSHSTAAESSAVLTARTLIMTSGIPLNQHIKVHKLPDPERREVA